MAIKQQYNKLKEPTKPTMPQDKLPQTGGQEGPGPQTNAKALAPVQPVGLPMAPEDRRGADTTLDQEDLVIPRANLLQPTSDDISAPGSMFRAGQIINSLTKEVLPEKFTPIFYWKEFTRFNPRKKEDIGFTPDVPPGSFMWTTKNENDQRVLDFCQGDKDMLYHLQRIVFFCVFDGCAIPILVSFAKTSYKAGRSLYSLVKFRNKPAFSQKYKLTTQPGKQEKGNYFTFVVTPAGDCNPEEFSIGENYFDQYGIHRDTLKTHVEDGE